MISVFVAICVSIAVTSAAPAGPPHHPGPDHHKLMPYAYQYGVKDEYHGVNFGENKESDGKVVHGSYHSEAKSWFPPFRSRLLMISVVTGERFSSLFSHNLIIAARRAPRLGGRAHQRGPVKRCSSQLLN